jgi:hypothetical protein
VKRIRIKLLDFFAPDNQAERSISGQLRIAFPPIKRQPVLDQWLSNWTARPRYWTINLVFLTPETDTMSIHRVAVTVAANNLATRPKKKGA